MIPAGANPRTSSVAAPPAASGLQITDDSRLPSRRRLHTRSPSSPREVSRRNPMKVLKSLKRLADRTDIGGRLMLSQSLCNLGHFPARFNRKSGYSIYHRRAVRRASRVGVHSHRQLRSPSRRFVCSEQSSYFSLNVGYKLNSLAQGETGIQHVLVGTPTRRACVAASFYLSLSDTVFWGCRVYRRGPTLSGAKSRNHSLKQPADRILPPNSVRSALRASVDGRDFIILI